MCVGFFHTVRSFAVRPPMRHAAACDTQQTHVHQTVVQSLARIVVRAYDARKFSSNHWRRCLKSRRTTIGKHNWIWGAAESRKVRHALVSVATICMQYRNYGLLSLQCYETFDSHDVADTTIGPKHRGVCSLRVNLLNRNEIGQNVVGHSPESVSDLIFLCCSDASFAREHWL